MRMVCLNSPPRGCLSFPTPRGAGCLSFLTPGTPGLSFPTTGWLRVSISPPHSGCRMDSTRSRSRLHPAAPSKSCNRTGGTVTSPSPPGSCERAEGHPRTPHPGSCEGKGGGTHGPLPHPSQRGLGDPLRTGASLRLLYVCSPLMFSPSRAPKSAKYRSGVCIRAPCVGANWGGWTRIGGAGS